MTNNSVRHDTTGNDSQTSSLNQVVGLMVVGSLAASERIQQFLDEHPEEVSNFNDNVQFLGQAAMQICNPDLRPGTGSRDGSEVH